MDDFGIEYVGKEHALHLLKTLEMDYEITTDWDGTKFAGINLAWNYHARHANRTCRISTKGYIAKVLLKYGHPIPKKPQLSPHKHQEILYGAKEQLSPEDDTSPRLDSQGTKRVQGIVGNLLYYARAVEKKLLVGLSDISSHQASNTQRTNEAINQILDYCATYPADKILYRSSDMVLCVHYEAGSHNESKGRIRAGAHIFISENDAMPQWNGPVISLSKITKFVMSSASEAELGAMFITAQEMVEMRHTLQEMKWPQPKYPLQTENSAAAGVVNNAIVPKNLNTMDRRLHWLRCRESQGQFRYYWESGNLNWGDHSTKNHPPLYHESRRMQFSGNPVKDIKSQ